MADILTIGSSKYNVKLRRTGSNFTIDVGDEISEGHFLRKSDDLILTKNLNSLMLCLLMN
jgi:hypothetical protein